MAVVVFQNLLGSGDTESLAEQIEAFRLIGSQSRTFKFTVHEGQDFEAALLGHEQFSSPQGPLTVAALGWDPPERSTHFHVSLMSADDDSLSTEFALPSESEAKVLKQEMARLNTKIITLLFGEGIDHGMVWEKRTDILTHDPKSAEAKGMKAALPEGDDENTLRRFLDDSINLLSELDFNRVRRDKGVKPINLAWPWGEGERQRVDNVALKLGYPWKVFASSLKMRGIARLSSLRVEPANEKLLSKIKSESRSMAVIDCGALIKSAESGEEAIYKLNELSKSFVMPLLDWQRDSKAPLTVVASNAEGKGLIAYVVKEAERDSFPFDERSLHERGVTDLNLSKLLELES